MCTGYFHALTLQSRLITISATSFNIHLLDFFSESVFMGFLSAIIFLDRINLSVFVMEMLCVFFEVVAEFLDII
jgi:hypothetical protein